MALPRQVEKQLEELEALEKQLTQPSEAVGDEGEAPPPRDPAPGEPDVEAVPVEATPEQPVATEKPVDWQQKYRTLQGMYDADVPRLHAQVKELTRKLDELAYQQKPTPAAEPPKQLVTDADVESFGSDLIDVQRRVAKEVFEEHVVPLRKQLATVQNENEQLRSQVQQTDVKATQTSFHAQLQRLVPDFDALNRDPAWIEWLNTVDPMLRTQRKAVAQQAFNAGDAEGVAHYVSLFKQGQSQSSQKQKELEKQVSPTRNSSSSSATAQGKTYSPQEVEKAFQKVAALSRTGKLDEANKLEAELTNAYAEGRVRAA